MSSSFAMIMSLLSIGQYNTVFDRIKEYLGKQKSHLTYILLGFRFVFQKISNLILLLRVVDDFMGRYKYCEQPEKSVYLYGCFWHSLGFNCLSH